MGSAGIHQPNPYRIAPLPRELGKIRTALLLPSLVGQLFHKADCEWMVEASNSSANTVPTKLC